MHQHFGIFILLLVAAFVTSCTSSQKAVLPDVPTPSVVAGQASTVSTRFIIQVAEDGTPSSVKVVKGSGHSALDQHTTDWIKKNWRWPASGKVRSYAVPVYYKTR